MKSKLLAVLMIVIVLLLNACINVTLPASSPAPAKKEQPADSPTPPPSTNPAPSKEAPPPATDPPPSQTETSIKEDTLILAFDDGTIIGGYSQGKWLTHSKAADLCKNKMTFYKYAMTGYVGEVVSTGVESTKSEEYYSGSNTKTDKDEGLYCALVTNELKEDWEYHTLFSVGPERLPTADVVSDTSFLLPAMQGLAGKKAGTGIGKVQIPIALSADIDGDGKQETVINADNGASIEAEYEKDKKWYSVACVMEDDGSIRVIEENYSDPEDFGTHVFLQNVFDIDSDGKCEFVLVNRSYEGFGATVYQYDGNKFNEVLSYANGV